MSSRMRQACCCKNKITRFHAMLQHASTWDNCQGSFFVSLTKKESTPKSLSQSFANVSGLKAFKTPDLLVQELQENIVQS
jgi:hypothetical protein